MEGCVRMMCRCSREIKCGLAQANFRILSALPIPPFTFKWAGTKRRGVVRKPRSSSHCKRQPGTFRGKEPASVANVWSAFPASPLVIIPYYTMWVVFNHLCE